jgi:hypothetical protein
MAENVPPAKDFFASPGGVCVYVEVRKIGIRVTFQSPDAAGETRLGTTADCLEALRLATLGMKMHREKLLPLFAKVARERARQPE